MRNAVYVYDIRLDQGSSTALPTLTGWHGYFFVFSGLVEAVGQRFGGSETGLATNPEELTIKALEPSVLVAFVIDRNAQITREGSVGDVSVLQLRKVVQRTQRCDQVFDTGFG